MGLSRVSSHRIGSLDSDQESAIDTIIDAGLSYDASNDRLKIQAKRLLVNSEATAGTAVAGEIAIGCSDATYGRALRLEHSTSASFNTFMNYSGVSGNVAGAMTGTSLSRLGINSSGDMTAYGDVKIAAEKVLELGTVASLGYEAASSNVQFSGCDLDMNTEDLLNAGGVGGDGRSIITRSFEITRAQLVAKGATNTGTFSLFTMDPNEAIRWAWVENAGSVNMAGSDSPSWIGVNVGRSGDTDSILAGSGSVNLINAGSVCDDNAIHGADFQAAGEMGDKGDPNDATTYYGEEEAIKAVVTIEAPGGKQLGNLTAGGPFYVHIETVRVDTAQIEATS